MTNHPQKKTFTSDRYYELRHELESDFHEDYDYSNAVAYGEIESVKICDNKSLEIDTTDYYDGCKSVPYHVTIHYLDKGKYGPKHTKTNDEFYGHWFNEFPDGSQYLSFDNCVFDVDVKIKDLKGISFQNCFFMKRVAIEGKGCEIVFFKHCYFGKYLDIHDLETDDLFIQNCNINNTLIISNCKVRKRASTHHDFVKLGFHLLESVFLGNECLFDNIKTGYELEIYNCVFKAPIEMTNCLIEYLNVKGSNFDNLNIDNIATHTYHTFEELSPEKSDEKIESLVEGPIVVIGDNEPSTNDPLIRRIKKFESAIGKANGRKSIIKFIHSNFNGLVTISDVKTTALVFGCCRAYDEVTIMKMDQDRYFSHNSGPVRTMIYAREKQEYDIQFLDLSHTIFYENTEIQNTYRFIDLSETKFKDHSNIDENYLNVTKGWPVKRISNDTRLIDYSSRTLQELLISCNRDDYDRKEELFLDSKTQERRGCRSIFKIGYICHELLSNYGKSPLRVLVVMAAIIGIFSLLFFGMGHDAIENCILDSFSSFFTIGLNMAYLDDFTTKSLVILEGALGVSLMSYFIVVLCDRRK